MFSQADHEIGRWRHRWMGNEWYRRMDNPRWNKSPQREERKHLLLMFRILRIKLNIFIACYTAIYWMKYFSMEESDSVEFRQQNAKRKYIDS